MIVKDQLLRGSCLKNKTAATLFTCRYVQTYVLQVYICMCCRNFVTAFANTFATGEKLCNFCTKVQSRVVVKVGHISGNIQKAYVEDPCQFLCAGGYVVACKFQYCRRVSNWNYYLRQVIYIH